MARQIQVQLRVPPETVAEIDTMIKKGKFTSRSEAIKSMINSYSEREKTREFYKLLVERSKDAKEHPEKLIPFSEL